MVRNQGILGRNPYLETLSYSASAQAITHNNAVSDKEKSMIQLTSGAIETYGHD